MKTIAVSGGFDPLHVGHIAFFEAAAAYGRLIVLVETDEWVSKKHPVQTPQLQRVQLVNKLECVYAAIPVLDNCSLSLALLQPDFYGVGPDHANHNQLEEWKECKSSGIQVITIQHERAEVHSSDLLKPKYINPPVVVSALIVGSAGGVAIQQRKETDGEGLWELPGGFLEAGESLTDGCCREVMEELGVTVTWFKYLCSIPAKYCDGRDIISVYFTCKTESEQLIKEVQWITQPSSLESKSFFADCDKGALIRYFYREQQ